MNSANSISTVQSASPIVQTLDSNSVQVLADNVSTSTVQLEATDTPATDSNDLSSYVATYFVNTPVLVNVAKCESQFRQFNKDGSVLRGTIVPQDIGVMQINETYQGATAQRLGFNIYTVAGNLGFAKWLYQNQGTQPWSASKSCWNK